MAPDSTRRRRCRSQRDCPSGFYETFGDEVTQELVDWLNTVDQSYRQGFRELFEAHFGRLDAGMRGLGERLRGEMKGLTARVNGANGRMQQLEAGLRREMKQLEDRLRGEMRQLAEQLEVRLRGEIQQLGLALRAELKQLEVTLRGEIGQLEARLETRLAQQDGRIGAFQEKLTGDLKAMKTGLIWWMVGLWFVTVAIGAVTRILGG